MKKIREHLKKISLGELMNLAKDSEAPIFEEDSPIRVHVQNIVGDGGFSIGLAMLRDAILKEITFRYLNKKKGE
jgi:hypothetical protein